MIYLTNPIVAMDDNHIQLINTLVLCNKPTSILEIGVGSGLVTKTILEALQYNQKPSILTCVDNFLDWNGQTPQGFDSFKDSINFINSNERDFVMGCKETYDFIVSDADHHHTNEWVDETYNLLNEGGILIYHDVTNHDFRNLYDIVRYAESRQINHVIFNKSSLPYERCERGLMVMFKNK